MSNIALRVTKLSKKYEIATGKYRHDTLREQLSHGIRSLVKRNGLFNGNAKEIFWALKDASFEVNHGEVVGLIGPNGAGKSTLLKLLSRITEPSSGRAEIYGRVASLLEVGTGFSGELTGRENVYLNGAILGMKKAEIDRKFDQIVDFSGVEKFIDTPVKRYSSGMHVRLAFAVAAHLEPEILIIDEVLAVGDASFQKKCLGKMQDVGKQGRTVLFVSHSMPAITRLCQRAILLDGGQIVKDGPAHEAVSVYLNSGLGTTALREWNESAKTPGNEVARLRAVRVHTEDGQVADAMDIRYPIAVDMEYEVLQPGFVLAPYFEFYNHEDIEVFSVTDLDPAWRRRPRPAGRYTSTTWIPGNLLSECTLYVRVGLASMNPTIIHFYERDVVVFQVYDTMEGDSSRGDWGEKWGGAIRPLLKWETQYTPLEDNQRLFVQT